MKRTIKIFWLIIAICVMMPQLSDASAVPNATNADVVYVLLVNNQKMEFKAWRGELESMGLTGPHWFPPEAAIIKLDSIIALKSIPAHIPALVYTSITDTEIQAMSKSSDSMRVASHAFKALIDSQSSFEQEDELMPDLIQQKNDALIPPAPKDKSIFGACNATQLKRSGAEYLLKGVSLNLILPESNGAIDASTENWVNSTRETTVTSEIVQAMNFLATNYNRHTALTPSFTYHYYFGRTDTRAQTSYEPINRAADPSTEPGTGEGLWANEIYNKLGYSSFSDRWIKGQEFNGDTRTADGTKWAFTIFVVDSLVDSDGQFTDGYFGYAWLGGPHVVMTYDNDGWGISQMDIVTRHESNHTFNVLDEYASSGCTCSEAAGYINYTNQNCENSCPFNGNCIMSSATKQQAGVICNYTRGMVGWGDADSDSVPDPVDINPETTLTPYSPDPTSNTMLTYTGQADSQKRTNQNQYNYHCDMTVVHISGVQYRADGGTWQNATACDGSFNSTSECYTFTVGPLAAGLHTIETRAVDEVGQIDATLASDQVTVTGSTRSGEALLLTVAKSGTNLSLAWTAPGGTCQVTGYGLYRGTLPWTGYNHASVNCAITATSTTTAQGTGSYYYLIVPSNASNEGSYGKSSAGAQRPQGTTPCKTSQDSTTC